MINNLLDHYLHSILASKLLNKQIEMGKKAIVVQAFEIDFYRFTCKSHFKIYLIFIATICSTWYWRFVGFNCSTHGSYLFPRSSRFKCKSHESQWLLNRLKTYYCAMAALIIKPILTILDGEEQRPLHQFRFHMTHKSKQKQFVIRSYNDFSCCCIPIDHWSQFTMLGVVGNFFCRLVYSLFSLLFHFIEIKIVNRAWKMSRLARLVDFFSLFFLTGLCIKIGMVLRSTTTISYLEPSDYVWSALITCYQLRFANKIRNFKYLWHSRRFDAQKDNKLLRRFTFESTFLKIQVEQELFKWWRIVKIIELVDEKWGYKV